MVSKKSRTIVRKNKHRRLRNRFSGTPLKDHAWLCLEVIIICTLRLLTIQVGKTLVSASTLDKDVKAECDKTNNLDAATAVGKVVAKRALEKGITTVVSTEGLYI